MSDHLTPPFDESSGITEYLQHDGGVPAPESEPEPRRGGRMLLIGGAAVGGLALAGAGAWAAMTLLGGGPQPTATLPADTLGFVSIDLDPSAAQKIEAMRMLNKFPAFKEEFGLDPTDDLRREIFDRVMEQAPCDNLSYDDDIEPWLGSRAAVAAVPDGTDTTGVLVVQVTDQAAAEKGLTKLRNCGTGGDAGEASEETGPIDWVVANGWAVLAESEKIAQGVVDDAEKGSLADDATYQKWAGEVGDAGVLSMYVSPDAAQFVSRFAEAARSQAGGLASGLGGAIDDSADPAPQSDMLSSWASDFGGMAGTVRFNDGSLELEMASASGALGMPLGDRTGVSSLVAGLPDDTAAAMGGSLPEGWLQAYLDNMTEMSGGELDGDELLDEVSQQTGLDLPADFETLVGEAFVVSLGSDLDPDAIANSSDGSEIPVAVEMKGDPEEIEAVLDKLRAQMGGDSDMIGSGTHDDVVVVSPSEAYRSAVLEGGSLGSTAAYADAVAHADDANGILFVNFDAGDGWLVNLAESDKQAAENLEPLSSLGVSAWIDGKTSHTVVRLTTD